MAARSDSTSTVTVGRPRAQGASPAKPTAGPTSTTPARREPAAPERADRRLTLEDKIAEGGMGIVWRGHQRHLGREVAVKTLPAGRTATRDVAQLLQEAWVTGQLEHPNIVPIHDIVFDEHGRPQVVLKRVEGRSWRALLRDPEAVRAGFQTDDPLEWHVRIVIGVCNALELAHSRGIVHRDIKPSNVMVGRFGEVYVLDWGLAVGLDADPTGRVPSLDASNTLAGSAAYMAPEQLAGVPDAVGRSTDIYLVGASLFEMVTGSPPFSERTIERARGLPPSPPPPIPSDVPEELARLIGDAMAPLPKERPATIRALRLRLEAFLEHRGSRILAAAADRAVEQLHRAAERGDEAAVETAFGQASFGYRAALQAWPGNDDARRALSELTLARARRALSEGKPEVAAQLIAPLEHVPPALREQIDRSQASAVQERTHAAALSREHDRTVGQRARQWVVALSGSIWVVVWSVLAWTGASAETMAWSTAGFVGLALVSAGLTRRDLLASKPNLGIFWTALSMMLAQLSLYLLGPGMGLSDRALMTLTPLLWALPCTIGAATIDARFAPVPAGFFLAFVGAAIWPSTLPWIVGAANLHFIVASLIVNHRVGRERAESAS